MRYSSIKFLHSKIKKFNSLQNIMYTEQKNSCTQIKKYDTHGLSFCTQKIEIKKIQSIVSMNTINF